MHFSHKRTQTALAVSLVALLVSLGLAACTGGEVPLASQQTTPPTPTATDTPTAPSQSEPNASRPLALQVLAPRDGAGVDIRAVRVFGMVRPDASVAVNGTPVTPASDGVFGHDVRLERGANYIEVVAADVQGNAESQRLAVFAVSPSASLPLSLFYPSDGLRVRHSALYVYGGTRQDAVVGVNGVPAEINALGIFSALVHLEPGANLIEVVGADANDNVSFQTVVVFYLP